MKLSELLYLTILALTTTAAPLAGVTGVGLSNHAHTTTYDTEDTHDFDSGSIARRSRQDSVNSDTLDIVKIEERGRLANKQSSPPRPYPPTKPPTTAATKKSSLIPLLQSFNMKTSFITHQPGSPGTNSLPNHAMEHVPGTVSLTVGNFDPSAIILRNSARLSATERDYKIIASVLQTSARTAPLFDVPISSEAGLSHILFQQVAGPLNIILRAIGLEALWTATGKGSAPVDDWRCSIGGQADKHHIQAVLELKTPDSLSGFDVQDIMKGITEEQLKFAPIFDKQKQKINSLVNLTEYKKVGDRAPRSSRQSTVKAVEQLIAQMYYSECNIGVLTNADDWLILEVLEPSSASPDPKATIPDVISVTHLKGQTEGQSNVLNILLAASLSAKSTSPPSLPGGKPGSKARLQPPSSIP